VKCGRAKRRRRRPGYFLARARARDLIWARIAAAAAAVTCANNRTQKRFFLLLLWTAIERERKKDANTVNNPPSSEREKTHTHTHTHSVECKYKIPPALDVFFFFYSFLRSAIGGTYQTGPYRHIHNGRKYNQQSDVYGRWKCWNKCTVFRRVIRYRQDAERERESLTSACWNDCRGFMCVCVCILL
jgi:hypothetical protein